MVLCFSGLVSTKHSFMQIAVSKISSALALKCVAEQSTVMDVIEKTDKLRKIQSFSKYYDWNGKAMLTFQLRQKNKMTRNVTPHFLLYPVCPAFASDNVYTWYFCFISFRRTWNCNIPFMKISSFYFTVCGFHAKPPVKLCWPQTWYIRNFTLHRPLMEKLTRYTSPAGWVWSKRSSKYSYSKDDECGTQVNLNLGQIISLRLCSARILILKINKWKGMFNFCFCLYLTGIKYISSLWSVSFICDRVSVKSLKFLVQANFWEIVKFLFILPEILQVNIFQKQMRDLWKVMWPFFC